MSASAAVSSTVTGPNCPASNKSLALDHDQPQMSLHIEASPLERADGSISYSCCGYSIIAAVHGPIEVQRRDELAEAAVIEVVVRPAIGIGGIVALRCMFASVLIRN